MGCQVARGDVVEGIWECEAHGEAGLLTRSGGLSEVCGRSFLLLLRVVREGIVLVRVPNFTFFPIGAVLFAVGFRGIVGVEGGCLLLEWFRDFA